MREKESDPQLVIAIILRYCGRCKVLLFNYIIKYRKPKYPENECMRKRKVKRVGEREVGNRVEIKTDKKFSSANTVLCIVNTVMMRVFCLSHNFVSE